MDFDREFMNVALDEAQLALSIDESPVGAVVVKDGMIISRAHNHIEELHDPTAHAEIIAIREAAKKLNNWRLIGCTMYVTMEPCPMCAGAMQQSRLLRVVYGVKDPKAGAAGSVMNLLDMPELNHRLRITSGVEEERCRELLNSFFRRLRA